MQALRAQADKYEHHEEMLRTLLDQPNLDILMAEVVRIDTKAGRVTGVLTKTGAYFNCQAVVVTPALI